MNNNYFNNKLNFTDPLVNQNTMASYMENVLKLNSGKKVTIYVTFPDSTEFRDMSLDGIVEQTGKDYIIISDPSNGKWHMIPTKYINYISFEEQINYNYNFM